MTDKETWKFRADYLRMTATRLRQEAEQKLEQADDFEKAAKVSEDMADRSVGK